MGEFFLFMTMFFLVIVIIIFLVIVLSIIPVETMSLRPRINLSKSYEESLRRVEEIFRAEIPPIVSHGRTILLTHGHKTKQVAVLYHGYTNSPRQYEQLAQEFFNRGFNVYVPRVLYHGLSDRLTKDICQLTVKDLKEVCDSSVDIASGLGEQITVLGLSMGGVMASWNAQFRRGIYRAIILDPSFGWYFFPGIVQGLVNAIFLLPNKLFWWDPIQKDKHPFPYSMYYHFSLHGMGHIMRLGLSVIQTARREAPFTKRIIMITNDADLAVDLKTSKDLMKNWKRWGTEVLWARFPRSLKMDHDTIDPLQPYAKVDIVYKKIFEYIEKA